MPAAHPVDPPAATVVVPVKAFTRAKRRLAPVLGPDTRAALARRMAERVLAAARPLPVTVVCDDDDVATWAARRGADVSWTPGLGLNGAVAATVRRLAEAGVTRVVVAHADLPLARDLAAVAAAPTGGVVLVPDRHDDGTNVVSVAAGAGFAFAYGAGSFRRHLAEAARLGLPTEVRRPATLVWDVDRPADLTHPDLDLDLGPGVLADPSATAAPCP